jgi:hypothetical protein
VNHAGHFLARGCAFAAYLDTRLHLQVIHEAVAGLCTAFANFSAHTAGPTMQRRQADHEIGAGLADLCTIQQQTDVIRIGLLAALS